MLKFIIRRALLMIPTLVAISIISFTIELPPGDYLTKYIQQLSNRVSPWTRPWLMA